jgi:hypothetical protein
LILHQNQPIETDLTILSTPTLSRAHRRLRGGHKPVDLIAFPSSSQNAGASNRERGAETTAS